MVSAGYSPTERFRSSEKNGRADSWRARERSDSLLELTGYGTNEKTRRVQLGRNSHSVVAIVQSASLCVHADCLKCIAVTAPAENMAAGRTNTWNRAQRSE